MLRGGREKSVLAAEQEQRKTEKKGVFKEEERSPGEKKDIMEWLPGRECIQGHKLSDAK